MKEYNLVDITINDFESFYNIMEEAFPEIERRNCIKQKEIFKYDSFKVIGYKDKKNDVIAFISYWNFKEFYYIEHFAVKKDFRGHKIGENLIKEFLKEKGKVVLEVELPEDNISKRRIEFYKRMGFNLNLYNYLQPPYENGNDMFPLMIMSYPSKINDMDYNGIKRKLYESVYKFHNKLV